MKDNPSSSVEKSGSADKPAIEEHLIASAIQSLERAYLASRKSLAEQERKTHRWAVITGSGVTAYTLVTVRIAVAAIWSAISAQKALKLTQEIAIADQRPIIWLSNHVGAPQLIRNQVIWDWEFTNYGKSPAVHIRFDTYMSLDKGPNLPTYGRQKSSIGAPLPPGKFDFDTVVSNPGINDTDFARLMALDEGISISGLSTYQDAGGRSYETTFCLAHLASGAIKYREPSTNCQNDIK